MAMTDNESDKPFQYSIRSILRVQAGLAGIIAVAVYVHNLDAGWSGETISGPYYAMYTVFWCCIGYFVARCFAGRLTAVLLSMVFAAMASGTFVRPKCDNPRDFAFFGMAVAVSAFVGFGWFDRFATPFWQMSGDARDVPATAKPPISPDREDAGG
jgi:hypothetical protein